MFISKTEVREYNHFLIVYKIFNEPWFQGVFNFRQDMLKPVFFTKSDESKI